MINFIPYSFFLCTRDDNYHLNSFFSFVEEAPKDHRDMKLDSVRLRYSSEVFDRVSEVAVIGRDALLFALGGEKSADEWVKGGVNLRLRSQPYLIKSPSRKIDWLVVFFLVRGLFGLGCSIVYFEFLVLTYFFTILQISSFLFSVRLMALVIYKLL